MFGIFSTTIRVFVVKVNTVTAIPSTFRYVVDSTVAEVIADQIWFFYIAVRVHFVEFVAVVVVKTTLSSIIMTSIAYT